VKVHRDLTSYQIREVVVEMTKMVSSDHDMFVLAVLSHGEEKIIYGSDAMKVERKFFTDKFNNENCPALRLKPKFMIFQACR